MRPVDKTSLSPFFVASIRSQSSSVIPEIGSCPSASQAFMSTSETSLESSARTTSTSLPSHWTKHWCMHRGRNTTIGVNPIPPKQHCVCTLTVDDEERGWDGLAANCQLHIEDTLCLRRLTVEIIEHHIGLDKISSGMTQPVQH